MPIVLSENPIASSMYYALMDSFVLDFMARQKLGGTSLTYFYLRQFPMLPPSVFKRPFEWHTRTRDSNEWVWNRVLELAYTSWDLTGYAEHYKWSGTPFKWDEHRRFLIRCELDAAFSHLYLPATKDGDWKAASIADGAVREETPVELAELKRYYPNPRDAVASLMDTFPIVRRKDEEKSGEYRTKRVIMEIYDEMAEAMRTGIPYKTRLEPLPGPPSDDRGSFLPLPEWKPGQPKPKHWPQHIHPPKEVGQ